MRLFLRKIITYVIFIFIIPFFVSCGGEKKIKFSVFGTDAVLFAKSRAGREGAVDLSKSKKTEYRFDDSLVVPSNSSLQIEYEIDFPQVNTERENYSLVLNTGKASWQLPLDFDGICLYSIPVDDNFNGQFYIMPEPNEFAGKKSSPVFKIRSISFIKRFFGFTSADGGFFFASPFVYANDSGYVIDIPSSFYSAPSFTGIKASFSSAGAVMEFAGRRFEIYPGTENISIPPVFSSADGYAALSADNVTSFYLNVQQSLPVFPKPVKADPALVVECPLENWRNLSYEIFRWDNFPSLLIFDFADYAVQDRMLKRLAFFTEKTGFRGRLAPDSEIESLHGWNAHDYRAEDLARFFDKAHKENFPLSEEERELEMILINEKIISEEKGSIVPGSGAIISISRESPDYLRYRFMAHEGFHGLYFIDEDFRNFSRQRWEQLPVTAKRFIVSYFGFQQYDTNDEYLIINEFMAHILQQPVSQSSNYFGRQLPQLLESTWRASALPAKDASSASWPALADAFVKEAEIFSAYVNRRWGLSAGRVWGLRIR
jgi:hypothetical protein